MALTPFLNIPAIDLMDGQVVRLRRGAAGHKTVYSDDPVAVAMRYEEAGAKRLHIVDLDGAFSGRPRNWQALAKIRRAVRMDIEVGGGLRKEEDVTALFDLGINYAILGTSALRDRGLVCRMVELHDERIIVGVDARDGQVAIEGWVETSDVGSIEFAKKLESEGVATIIVTDISTDGMMEGPDLDGLADLSEATQMNIIASGGVRNVEDLKAIRNLGHANIIGAIIGRAIYEGELNIRDAVATVV